jgi:predicted transposase/invertase (TIGR01784 family)
MERKLISFDWAIKKLLRSKANFGILEGFLSELLFVDVTIVDILESESDREHKTNKKNQVDIKVRDAQGQLILIEVQYSREQDYLFRILFGSAKCVTEHLDIRMDYRDVSKVISVSILYFDFCAGGDYIYHGTTEFIGLHNHTKLELNSTQQGMFNCEKVADIFPEHYIINIKNFDDIAIAPLDEWIYFLKNEEIKEDFHAKGLLEAKEKLDIIKLSPAEKVEYERHMNELRRERSLYQSSYVTGKQEGKVEGREEGREEGKAISDEQHHQKTVESVKTMLKMGMAIADVTKITGLAIDEIKLIKTRMNDSDDK